MPRISVQDGKLVLHNGKIGAGQECCCGSGCGDCPHCAIDGGFDGFGNPYVVGCGKSEDSAFDYCGLLVFSSSSRLVDGFGWPWAAGYPAAFNGCPYFFVVSEEISYAKCDNFDECDGGCTYAAAETRVWKLDCATKTLTDVTEEATEGGQPLLSQTAAPYPGSPEGCECNGGSFPTPSACTPTISCGACCSELLGGCVEGLPETTCTDPEFLSGYAGTWHADARCADEPCNPLP